MSAASQSGVRTRDGTGESGKELALLDEVARALERSDRPPAEVLGRIADLLARAGHASENAEIERQNGRLRALTREVALAEERQRRAIARDLHDHLGQALAFIRMQLSDLQGDVMFSGFEARLESMGDLLDQSIAYTRTLTAEISPPVLYELGFLPAVRWLADRMRKKHALPVKVKVSGDASIGEEATRIVTFLAVRELLINAVKHAGAREVVIALRGEPDAVLVEVGDDGAGFDPGDAGGGDGFGLFSLGERIRSLGGTVEIESASGRGTRVKLRVPRGPADHEDPARR